VFLKFFAAQLAIAQDSAQQAHANSLARVHWNNSHATIGVSDKMMAAFDPDNCKSAGSQCSQ